MAPSQHDGKIVYRDVKQESKQNNVIENTGIIFSGLKKAEVFNILILLVIQKIFLKMGHTSDQGGFSCRPGWDNYRLDPKFSDTKSVAENHS